MGQFLSSQSNEETQKRRFIILKNDEAGIKQIINARLTKRRLQRYKPLNETLRYGRRNTFRRYMQNYENEYVSQKYNKIRRNTRIPSSVVEQVVEQTVPGVSFFGWIGWLFGASPPSQQQQPQQQQQQQSQQSQQQQPQSSQRSRVQSINSEIRNATTGDRKASNRLLSLETEEEKRRYLGQYLAIKQIGDERKRDIAFLEFYSIFTNSAPASAASAPAPASAASASAASASAPASSRSAPNSIQASAKRIYEYAINKLTKPSSNNRKIKLKKPIYKQWDSLTVHTLTELRKALESAKQNGISVNTIEDYITVIDTIRSSIINKIPRGGISSPMASIQELPSNQEEGIEPTYLPIPE
jgi:hypothetical protein